MLTLRTKIESTQKENLFKVRVTGVPVIVFWKLMEFVIYDNRLTPYRRKLIESKYNASMSFNIEFWRGDMKQNRQTLEKVVADAKRKTADYFNRNKY